MQAPFETEFPNVQRLNAAPGPDLGQLHGQPPLNLDPTTARWWFVSDDDAHVLQVQDNMFSVNWRSLSPPAEHVAYPGFDNMLASYQRNLALLKDWHSKRGFNIADPMICELMYDDIISLGTEGGPQRASDIITLVNPYHRSVGNWQMAWMEPMEDDLLGNRSVLTVQITTAGVAQNADAPPKVILRIIWKAMAMRDNWDDVVPFFNYAHAFIRDRFQQIVKKSWRDSWGIS